MFELICHITLVLILGIAFFQDWKYRAISWLVFPLLLFSAIGLFQVKAVQWDTLWFNLVFLTVVLSCLFLYVSLKNGQWTNIFKADLGLGDVLFLIAVSPLFSEHNFILFFITGMLLSGLFHLIVFARNKEIKIPLAGYLAVYIILLKGCSFCIEKDLFYSNLIG